MSNTSAKQQGSNSSYYHPVVQYLSFSHKRFSLPVLLHVHSELIQLPVVQLQHITYEEILQILKNSLLQVFPIQYNNQNHEEAIEVYGTLLVEAIFSSIFTFHNPRSGSSMGQKN